VNVAPASSGTCGVAMAFYSLLIVSLGAIVTAVSGAQDSPVTKVVQLLNLMHAKLSLDQKEDDEIQTKMECWCNKTKVELLDEINTSEAEVATLKDNVQAFEDDIARITAEIREKDAELANLKETSRQMMDLRSHEHAVFVESENELTEIIGAVDAAVIALQKHNSTAKATFLEVPASRLRPLASLLVEHADTLNRLVTPLQREKLLLFTKSQLGLGKMFAQPYEWNSGEVSGTLTQMLEQFQNQLAGLRETETSQANKTEVAMNQSLNVLLTAQHEVDEKTSLRAAAEHEGALAKKELADMTEILEADKESLVDQEESCAASKEEHNRRQETRHMEIEAVGVAAAKLDSDETRELFGRTFSSSFFQARLATESPADVWDATTHGEFNTNITKNVGLIMSPLIGQLKDLMKVIVDEMQTDTEQRDKCTEMQHSASMSFTITTRVMDDVEAKLVQLNRDVKRITFEEEGVVAAKGALLDSLSKRSKMRVQENAVFMSILSDGRTTKALLGAAKGVLLHFYGDRTALAQHKQLSMTPHDASEKPHGVDGEYERHPQSENVVDMIQVVLDDITVMLAEEIHDEEENQHLYERFVKDTNSAVHANDHTLTELTEEGAKAKLDVQTTNETLSSHTTDFDEASATHKEKWESEGSVGCEHILNNFALRRKAMEEELESYRRAVHVLSGADFGDGPV